MPSLRSSLLLSLHSTSRLIYLQCRVAFAGESLIVLIGFVSSFRLHKIIVRKRVLLNWKICMSCLYYVPSSSPLSLSLPHSFPFSFCPIACQVPWFIDFPQLKSPFPLSAIRDFLHKAKSTFGIRNSKYEIQNSRLSSILI